MNSYELYKKYNYEVDKPSITELYGKHGSLPVAVLGGGPTLPEDLEKLPKDVITIACNHHAGLAGVTPDYLIFKDDPRKHALLKEFLFTFRGVVLSTIDSYTDYIFNVAKYDRGFTGTLATWVACQLTDGEVILAGMDCYTSKTAYFHNQGVPATWGHYSDRHVDKWKLAYGTVKHITGCRMPERICAVSGPLTEVFKPYESK